jgi:hypothetical protein
MRTIQVWHPNRPQKKFEVEVQNVKELVTFLKSEGYECERFKLREGRTMTLLDRPDQMLPHAIPYRGVITDDLVIIFSPEVTIKSGGSLDYKSAKAIIKGLRDELDPEEFRACFGDYTHDTVLELNRKIDEYRETHGEEYEEEEEEVEYSYPGLGADVGENSIRDADVDRIVNDQYRVLKATMRENSGKGFEAEDLEIVRRELQRNGN